MGSDAAHQSITTLFGSCVNIHVKEDQGCKKTSSLPYTGDCMYLRFTFKVLYPMRK
ncbi:hypothetical protein ACE6H2_008722 [Prunus campanulata]